MTSLSSPFARQYRLLHFILIPCIIIGLVIMLYAGKTEMKLFNSINAILFSYILWKRGQLLKPMSYDSEYLYIREGKQEEVIPLHAIARIELKTLGGGWDIYFKPGYTPRESLIFIPSLLYPLNFKKIEARVDAFEKTFRQAKEKATPRGIASSSLSSET